MKLRKPYLLGLLICALFITNINGQELGELKSKQDNFGVNPKSKASKKVCRSL